MLSPCCYLSRRSLAFWLLLNAASQVGWGGGLGARTWVLNKEKASQGQNPGQNQSAGWDQGSCAQLWKGGGK